MYALIKNNQVQKYPYWISDFLKDHPNISLPQTPTKEQLEGQGLFEVQDTPKPFTNYFEVAVEVAPVKENGVWKRSWSVRDATNQEESDAKLKIKNDIVAQTQLRLDTFAQSRGYDGILSACTYATSTVPKFKTEGQYCVNQRDATWNKLYQLLGEVEAGTRPMPNSFSDIEPLLPILSWPN